MELIFEKVTLALGFEGKSTINGVAAASWGRVVVQDMANFLLNLQIGKWEVQ